MNTDPMTPVRALIEATKDCHRLETVDYSTETAQILYAATASISQLLSEHDKVVVLEKELRETPVHMGSVNIRVRKQCADALAAIVEGK